MSVHRLRGLPEDAAEVKGLQGHSGAYEGWPGDEAEGQQEAHGSGPTSYPEVRGLPAVLHLVFGVFPGARPFLRCFFKVFLGIFYLLPGGFMRVLG